MQAGISIYPGLDNSPEVNLSLLQRAAEAGVRRMLLAIILPHANLKRVHRELMSLLKVAQYLGIDIIAALTPEMMRALQITSFSFASFQFIGITTLYLGDSFSMPRIAEFSRNLRGMKIQFNASRMTAANLALLLHEEPRLDKLDALHSAYPREGTGLSEENLIKSTVTLHEAGIPVGAFVPSAKHRRSPFGDGITSLESHRHMEAELALRHYAAIGMDSAFFGDSLPSAAELAALKNIHERDVALRIRLKTEDPWQREMLRRTYTARIDEARDAIRAQEGENEIRRMNRIIAPENILPRYPGDVTIDNINAFDFMGEVQIMKREAKPCHYVNVAASVNPDELFLLDYIMPGRRFRFLFD